MITIGLCGRKILTGLKKLKQKPWKVSPELLEKFSLTPKLATAGGAQIHNSTIMQMSGQVPSGYYPLKNGIERLWNSGHRDAANLFWNGFALGMQEMLEKIMQTDEIKKHKITSHDLYGAEADALIALTKSGHKNEAKSIYRSLVGGNEMLSNAIYLSNEKEAYRSITGKNCL